LNVRLNLRAGQWVEVRSKEAILATLDEHGRLDGLPFMPEMFAYCGTRRRVWKRAHKTCDTVNKTGGRRMIAAVHLEDARCDGSAHGGCQAECLLFWKEAWLQRVDGPDAPLRTETRPPAGQGALEEQVWAATHLTGEASDADVTYVCQATMLPQATTPLLWWDVSQYLEDCTSGNSSLWQLVCGGTFVCYQTLVNRVRRRSSRLAAGLVRLYDRVLPLSDGVPYPRRRGTIPTGQKTPSRPLDLKVGDLVQIRSYDEIVSTLDGNNRNRGMYFDAEEVPYCGKQYRVRSTVNKIIHEKTGKMLTLKDHNVILEGVICQARYSDRRMFCPRAIYAFWRETWLEKVAQDADLARGEREANEPQA
jgi:hypothetical protein